MKLLGILATAIFLGDGTLAFQATMPHANVGRHTYDAAASASPTQLHLFRMFRRGKNKEDEKEEIVVPEPKVPVGDMAPKDVPTGIRPIPKASSVPVEEADVIVIGGGVSGLTAAIAAVEGAKKAGPAKVLVLEASSKFGGRVTSETSQDGFVFDQGFAVFIEEYPMSKKLLDYEKLSLKPFLPGAFIKLKSRTTLARVSDPLRVPSDIFTALAAPVGSINDKIDVLPLILNTRIKTIDELFEERETDTLSALKERWGFSDDFIQKFFGPFLEGIYLAPLAQQSSRMFSFIFKMFSEGSATLPKGGMVAITDQLVAKAESAGVDLRASSPVSRIELKPDGTYGVEIASLKKRFQAPSIIVATDGRIAQQFMSQIEGFQSLEDLPEQPQRAVGCMYYGFDTEVPVKEPILILNGYGELRGNDENPVNNVCFPSVVNEGYAPEGYNLCSVTILADAMKSYMDRPDELDEVVRKQLGAWFPAIRSDIQDKWELKKIFYIPNAQPGQLNGPFPANVNGGRPANSYRGKETPTGLFICGDHMATATLNGALESGDNAGKEAAKVASKAIKAKAASLTTAVAS